MEREILFRVWDKSYNQYLPNDVYAVTANDQGLIVMIKDWKDYQIGEYGYNHATILEQYTGLKDKNGTKIFEGDLLGFDANEWGGDFDPEVMQMECLIGCWDYAGTITDVSEWRQITGNIHDK